MPVQNKKYDGFYLSEKRNGAGRISSFTININTKEAHALGFIDDNGNSYALKKELINNTLVISRASNNEKSVKLQPKKSHGHVSSYNLSISFKEALALDVVYKQLASATATRCHL